MRGLSRSRPRRRTTSPCRYCTSASPRPSRGGTGGCRRMATCGLRVAFTADLLCRRSTERRVARTGRLAEAVFGDVPELSGVVGDAATAAAFTGRWTELAGASATPVEGQRLYELGQVESVPPVRRRHSPRGFRRRSSSDRVDQGLQRRDRHGRGRLSISRTPSDDGSTPVDSGCGSRGSPSRWSWRCHP